MVQNSKEAQLRTFRKVSFVILCALLCRSGVAQAPAKVPFDLASMEARAEQADVNAMTKLGEAYWGKQGIPADIKKGTMWLDKAAQAGSIEAQVFLGSAYLSGTGLQKDNALAAKYLIQASQQSHVQSDFQGTQAFAQYLVSKLYEHGEGVERSHERAIHFLELAADNGNPGAQFDLGSLYNDGTGGMQQDKVHACALFERAANQGDVRALHNTAFCYQTGIGVTKDVNKAIELYTRAAEGGSVRSEFNLAMGYGDVGNADRAYFWLRVAQSSGYSVDNSLIEKAKAHLSAQQMTKDEAEISDWLSAHPLKTTPAARQ